MKNFLKLFYFIIFFPVSFSSAQFLEQGDKYNRLSVGISGVHFYDFFRPGQQVDDNGVLVNDMKGLNGEKTNFDVGLGMDLTYFFSPILSLDLNYSAGSMSGADTMQNEYYKADVNSFGLGVNLALKSSNSIVYRWVPFVRCSFGNTRFSSSRFFVADDVENFASNGSVFSFGAGAGMRYHISNSVHLSVQSEYMNLNSNALDGYSIGKGRDSYLQTKFGIRYSFGKNNRHRDRSAAWQGSVSPTDLAQLKENTSLSFKRVETAVGEVGSRIEVTERRIDDVDKGVKKIAEDTNNKFSALEATKRTLDDSKLVLPSDVMVLFDLGSAKLKKDQQMVLQSVLFNLSSNSALKIRLTPFTDPTGSESANEKLRGRRAKAVQDFLIRNGVEMSKISFSPWPGVYSGENTRDRRVTVSFSL